MCGGGGIGVLCVDRLRGKREQHGGQGRGRDPDQADSEMDVIDPRMSGTIGSSGG